MRIQLICIFIGVGAICQGCQLSQDCVHNVIHETHRFLDEVAFRSQARKLATEVWNQLRQSGPEQSFSEDYVRGFKQGFVDYLDSGDPCEPPMVLPHEYQRLRYQNPEGRAAITDWQAGFRHGANVARNGGYRQFLLQPVSLRAPNPATEMPVPKELPAMRKQQGNPPAVPVTVPGAAPVAPALGELIPDSVNAGQAPPAVLRRHGSAPTQDQNGGVSILGAPVAAPLEAEIANPPVKILPPS